MSNKNNIFFLLILILISKTVFAVDTLSFENCENIGLECPSGEGISLDEQKEIVLSMLLNEKMPAHNFVYNWNTGLNFSSAPDSILEQNHLTIKNAWMKVLTAIPSVFDKDTLYTSDQGTLQTEYNYLLTLPEMYYNGRDSSCGPGATNELGDCKTEYPSNEDISYLEINQNDNLIGDKKLTKFTSEDTNNFEAKLFIKNKILRKHWKWKRTGDCCKRECSGKGEERSCYCVKYTHNCKLNNEDYRIDELDLTDSLLMEKVKTITYLFKQLVFDIYDNRKIAYLDTLSSNIESYGLKISDAVMKKSFVDYDINYSYLPYNILTINAVHKPEFFVKNIHVINDEYKKEINRVKFEYYPSVFDDCEITIRSFFEEEEYDCNYTVLPKTSIAIETNKLSYSLSDKIEGKVEFTSEGESASGTIKLKYGDYIKDIDVDGTNSFELIPNKEYDMIEAFFNTDFTKSSSHAAKQINVGEGYRTVFYVYVILLFALIVIGIRKIKKYL